MSTGKPSVFLIHDSVGTPSLKRVLERVGHRVECFPAEEAYLDRDPFRGIGCVLCNYLPREPDGLDFLECLTSRGDDLPIVFLARHVSVSLAVRAMKRGAFDFLEEPLPNDQLMDAVASALFYHRKRIAERRQSDERQNRFEALSPREREVCVLAASGLLNKQIAGQLGTSERTVKKQRGNAMSKLRFTTVTDLVRFLSQVNTESADTAQFQNGETRRSA